jgi:hypothetical protein
MSTTIPYSEFIGSHDPYPVLESTPKRIAELIDGLSDEQITSAPQPGKWSIHQIVAHLADNELMANARFRLILFEDSPTLVAYDQEQWMNGWVRENEPFSATLERFRVLRESTVRLVRSTPERDMRRYGTHTERGVVTVIDYVITNAGHDINHLAQIEGIRTQFLDANQ